MAAAAAFPQRAGDLPVLAGKASLTVAVWPPSGSSSVLTNAQGMVAHGTRHCRPSFAMSAVLATVAIAGTQARIKEPRRVRRRCHLYGRTTAQQIRSMQKLASREEASSYLLRSGRKAPSPNTQNESENKSKHIMNSLTTLQQIRLMQRLFRQEPLEPQLEARIETKTTSQQIRALERLARQEAARGWFRFGKKANAPEPKQGPERKLETVPNVRDDAVVQEVTAEASVAVQPSALEDKAPEEAPENAAGETAASTKENKTDVKKEETQAAGEEGAPGASRDKQILMDLAIALQEQEKERAVQTLAADGPKWASLVDKQNVTLRRVLDAADKLEQEVKDLRTSNNQLKERLQAAEQMLTTNTSSQSQDENLQVFTELKERLQATEQKLAASEAQDNMDVQEVETKIAS